MSISHLAGLQVAGVPTMGTGGILPFTGNYFFVNETTGSDGNVGTADLPLATLAQAHTMATANNDDVVFFSGSIHQTASLAWSKNRVHLIGLANGIRRGKRARISPATSLAGTAGFDKLVNVTASGCLFANFGTFYGWTNTAAALICWEDDGGRNCYDGVEFLGFGDGTVATGSSNLTGSRAFKMNNNVGETTFLNCVFGTDTTVRNAANHTIELVGGAPRLTFMDCAFEADLGSSGAGSSHVLIGASGIDRYVNFVRCRFMNAIGSGATAMTQCFNINASPGGIVLLQHSTGYGFTNWETTATARLFNDMPAVAATDAGIAIAAAP